VNKYLDRLFAIFILEELPVWRIHICSGAAMREQFLQFWSNAVAVREGNYFHKKE
jgi:hypothetical protein